MNPGPGRSTPEYGTRRVRWRGPATGLLLLGLVLSLLWLLTSDTAGLALGVTLLALPWADRWAARRALATPGLHLALPPTVVSGQSITLLVALEGTTRPVRIDLVEPWSTCTVLATPGESGSVLLGPAPRGLVHTLVADLVVVGPLGLIEVSRGVRLHFEPSLAVGPEREPHRVRWPEPVGVELGFDAASPRGDALTRGVRDYRPGDPRRRVHWKATARAGHLMVRETEGDAVAELAVVLRLAGVGAADEAAASRAQWMVEEALGRGWRVTLITWEQHHPPPLSAVPVDELVRPPLGGVVPPLVDVPPPRVVARAVHSRSDLLRRLAAAVPGDLPEPSSPVLLRRIRSEGDGWR